MLTEIFQIRSLIYTYIVMQLLYGKIVMGEHIDKSNKLLEI